MIYYEPVKIIIDTQNLAKVILDVIVQYHGLFDFIVSDWGLVFTLKFWLSLYYFLKIKRKLSITFYPQINDQTEMQNSMMKAYLRVFIN